MRLSSSVVAALTLAACCAGSLAQQADTRASQQHTPRTRIVMLGTGTPFPDPDRSGPATAIIVNGSAYLVDLGPGVVRRAKAAVLDKGIRELEPANLKVAFLTHLHSDHTVGYPDLIFTGWTAGRRTPLQMYGPSGLREMTEHILQAWHIDISARISPEGNQKGMPDGWKVEVHDVHPGVIYKDANVTVTAFPTQHGIESYGYRFDTADRSIVIPGDTKPTEETIRACNGCDVLIHEAQTLQWFAKQPEASRVYGLKYHTTSEQLAALATAAKPRLLIVHHSSTSWRPELQQPSAPGKSAPGYSPPDVLESELRSRYTGAFVVARDLDVY